MSKQNYFQDALANFTFDVASGGAIRHLTDLGFTVKQISQKLAFPTSYDRIQKAVWEHLLDMEVILLTEPGRGEQREKFTYVREYDRYGRASFRRVPLADCGSGEICWKERRFGENGQDGLASYLAERCRENNGEGAYMSCDFGLRSKREPERWTKALNVLEEQLREYVLGLPWERKVVYHRLNGRMREILVSLYEHGEYEGICYFGGIQEKLIVEKKKK